MVRVILKKRHTHAGRDLDPGTRIEVAEDIAAWLAERGIADEEKRRRRKARPRVDSQRLEGDDEAWVIDNQDDPGLAE